VEDLSDLEREEQLRSFWRDNWLTLVGGVAIGLGAIAGWRYWQSHTRQQAEQAEAAYTGVIEALAANKRDDAATRAVALREGNPSSPYADQADLALARAVGRRDRLGQDPVHGDPAELSGRLVDGVVPDLGLGVGVGLLGGQGHDPGRQDQGHGGGQTNLHK